MCSLERLAVVSIAAIALTLGVIFLMMFPEHFNVPGLLRDKRNRAQRDKFLRTRVGPLLTTYWQQMREGDPAAIDALIQLLTTADRYGLHHSIGLTQFSDDILVSDCVTLPDGEAAACAEWLRKHRENLKVDPDKGKIVFIGK